MWEILVDGDDYLHCRHDTSAAARAVLAPHPDQASAELHAELNGHGPRSIVVPVTRIQFGLNRWYAVLELDLGADWGEDADRREAPPVLVADYVRALHRALLAAHSQRVPRPTVALRDLRVLREESQLRILRIRDPAREGLPPDVLGSVPGDWESHLVAQLDGLARAMAGNFASGVDTLELVRELGPGAVTARELLEGLERARDGLAAPRNPPEPPPLPPPVWQTPVALPEPLPPVHRGPPWWAVALLVVALAVLGLLL